MIRTLFDHMKYNNVHYNELKDEESKRKIERFVLSIQSNKELEHLILSFPQAYEFNARNFWHNGKDFISGFPDDLSYKMISLWIKTNDEPVSNC